MNQPAPLALQLAVRMERGAEPDVATICRSVALTTIALLDDPRSKPGGPWHDAVAAWNGARIRKIVRRGRGAAWERAHEVAGLTLSVDGVSARAFVPGPMDEAPPALAKLQIQSTDLPPPTRSAELATGPGLAIAVTPLVDMSWGKQAAQCAHAAQRAWMTADDETRQRWHRAGRPIHVIHPTEAAWPEAQSQASTVIADGGYTEIPAGTQTTCAWWAHGTDTTKTNDPGGRTMTRTEIRLGGPNELRLGLSRAVRTGDHIVVGGTAPIAEDGANVDPHDVAAQARRVWDIIESALDAAGATLADVTRTRTMLVDIDDYDSVTQVRRQRLGTTMPVDTIVEVSRFVDADWRIEIEVDAVVAG